MYDSQCRIKQDASLKFDQFQWSLMIHVELHVIAKVYRLDEDTAEECLCANFLQSKRVIVMSWSNY